MYSKGAEPRNGGLSQTEPQGQGGGASCIMHRGVLAQTRDTSKNTNCDGGVDER